MRVLQINSVCGYGSTGRIATDLYDVLEKEGHECCIAYGRGTAPKGYKTIKIGGKIDFYTHVLKTRFLDLHGFGSKRATKTFVKQIEEYKPNIILLHNIHGYYLNIEILFNYFATIDVPIVWLLHDAWPISGHSAYFDLDSNGEVPMMNLKKKQNLEYPKSFFIDNSRKNFLKKKSLLTQISNMTIITPSNWLANIVKKSFLSSYDVKVIHNGIDLSKFKVTPSNFRDKEELTNKKIILGVASMWDERKGLIYFNQLAKHLNKEFKVIVVGVDKKQNKKLNKNILAISRTNDIKELAEIYTAADVYVNPTLEDNFPTTNVEALACGTPVITFDTGGSPEALNNETGEVIEKGNFYSLYKTIKNLDYEKKNSEACIEQSKEFEKVAVYNKYLNLFQNLIMKAN
ncbi:glycosyltransferase [Jeotgalibaca sp. A127]|uniref:glycosyltransferase n=1 Tax=Jeotgalibaca sp. A127 TaxID=3457324 RepID=UPI003FD15119